MEVYFTSPIIGKVYGSVSTEDYKTYCFKGNTALISIEICRNPDGDWVCPKEHWLHDYQIEEIGLQIDKLEKWLSAQ